MKGVIFILLLLMLTTFFNICEAQKSSPVYGRDVKVVCFEKETWQEMHNRSLRTPKVNRAWVKPRGKRPPSRTIYIRNTKRALSRTNRENQTQASTRNFTATSAGKITLGFQGLKMSGGKIPPDTMGVVGPSHIVETLNSDVAVFNKTTGAVMSGPTALKAWWAGGAIPADAGPFDPKLLYDPHSQRYIFTCVAIDETPDPDESYLFIAISQTSDPTGAWYKWAIDANVEDDSIWADFPCLGVDANYVYVSVNMFQEAKNSRENEFKYPKIFAISKAMMLAGSADLGAKEFPNPYEDGSGFTIQPAFHYDDAGGTGYLIGEGFKVEGESTRIFRIASITNGGTFNKIGYIKVNEYSDATLTNAAQLGSDKTVEVGDQRLCAVTYRHSHLWVCHTIAYGSQTQIAWYQINPAVASETAAGLPFQQGRINSSSRWYYYPSIAVNKDQMVAIGFAGSSTSEYIGGFFTLRQSTDTHGQMREVTLVKAGESSYYVAKEDRNRWGDFSATCVDPSDDFTFWTVQEYADTTQNKWATWWGKIQGKKEEFVKVDGDGGWCSNIAPVGGNGKPPWPFLLPIIAFILYCLCVKFLHARKNLHKA